MECLDNLRNIVEMKIKLTQKNIDEIKKYELIKELLRKDDCFFTIKIDTAYAILQDLEFSNQEIPIIYEQLTNEKTYKQIKKNFYIQN